MPSYVHELLLLLFRNRSRSAADLLRTLEAPLPEYDDVGIESSDLCDVQPAEYRADLVLFLRQRARKVLGVIVEAQLQPDDDKRYAWPAYVANLRARHRCPACVLVVTLDESVSRWARKTIELGPGSRFTPWVVGPGTTPAVTDLAFAEENVELAVLSAIEHGRSTDIELAARIASTAILASAGVDAERSRLYLDLILMSLSEHARGAIQKMNSLGFEYQSDFARKYVAQGRAEGKVEGKVEGKAELVIRLLTRRFGPLTADTQAQIRGAADSRINAIAERLLTAQSLEEALTEPCD
jgi:hypothetical protein